jgi:two-component system, OmpR family, alkaline phosphatase synthesis response regulator PhoP
MQTILIVEDEEGMAESIQDVLHYQRFNTLTVSSGEEALELIKKRTLDLIILDVMLTGIDGFETCRIMRDRGYWKPILMLTARSEEADKVIGLEIGADDYITKPFSPRELAARVKAHLRKTGSTSNNVQEIAFDDVTINFKECSATRKGKIVQLTSAEFSILHVFAKYKNTVISRDKILNEVWGTEYMPDSRTVDTHVFNIRNKLEKNPHKPKHFLTIHGRGYKFM